MEIKEIGEVKSVVMIPRFDAFVAKEIESEFIDMIEKGSSKILCDFSQTEYISSAGLRVLLVAAKKLQQNDGKLILCNMGSYVYEVFETSGFTKLFEVYNTEEQALQSLSK
jgi:anti-anti-sigma factor